MNVEDQGGNAPQQPIAVTSSVAAKLASVYPVNDRGILILAPFNTMIAVLSGARMAYVLDLAST